MRPRYITGRMGSEGEKKVLFIYTKHATFDWLVKCLNNCWGKAGKKMEKRAEMRRGENESGVKKPLMGAVSSHVIPLIAFLQLSHWQDCREGKSAPTRTRSVTRTHTNTCMYATLQCDRAAREKSWNDPLFFEHHLSLRRPQFHRVLACLWGNNNHMYRIGFFMAAEGIEVTIRFISRVKFYG